jgi:hypothetical protein
MGRTFSLLGLVVFTVGVVALSSLARRTPSAPPSAFPDDAESREGNPPARRAPSVFAYDTPFSLN